MPVTAVPSRDVQRLDLICDGCGHSLSEINASMHNWDVVWALVSKQGWTGSPLAIGPHRCPQCNAPSPGGTEDATAPADRPRWQADLRSVDEIAVVELHGDLDVLVVDDLRELITKAGDSYANVILDLGDVRLIDSSGLGAVVRAHQNAKRNGGVLCLVAPSPFIVTVLHTMRLHSVFPIFDSCDQAVKWIVRCSGG